MGYLTHIALCLAREEGEGEREGELDARGSEAEIGGLSVNGVCMLDRMEISIGGLVGASGGTGWCFL